MLRRWRSLTLIVLLLVALAAAGLGVTYGKGAYWLLKRGGQWSISVYTGETLGSLRPMDGVEHPAISAADVTDVRALFVADPFMQRAEDGWAMFFEVYNIRTDQGDIGLATSPDGRTWTYDRIVLDEPFHMSYPIVFEWQGEHYLVPESYQAGAIRLYRAEDYPRRWQFVGELVRGAFGDPTIFRHDGRWWLFAESNQPHGNDTLSLFFADELTGPWTEHPMSPVVRGDKTAARPAGRVIEADGRLIRFAQDCTPLYGTAVRGFEITELTPTTYQERPLETDPLLGPSGEGWNADGMHQLDPHPTDDGGWIACVDGQQVVRWIGLQR